MSADPNRGANFASLGRTALLQFLRWGGYFLFLRWRAYLNITQPGRGMSRKNCTEAVLLSH